MIHIAGISSSQEGWFQSNPLFENWKGWNNINSIQRSFWCQVFGARGHANWNAPPLKLASWNGYQEGTRTPDQLAKGHTCPNHLQKTATAGECTATIAKKKVAGVLPRTCARTLKLHFQKGKTPGKAARVRICLLGSQSGAERAHFCMLRLGPHGMALTCAMVPKARGTSHLTYAPPRIPSQ